jgi:hypothetical protein
MTAKQNLDSMLAGAVIVKSQYDVLLAKLKCDAGIPAVPWSDSLDHSAAS